MNVQGINQLQQTLESMRASAGAGPAAPKVESFGEVLMKSVEGVQSLQSDADAKAQALVLGKTDNISEVMTAINKAGVAFDLLMETRNRMVEAYQEIQQIRF
jgi:flagellar hook-basal body complex protein FliE